MIDLTKKYKFEGNEVLELKFYPNDDSEHIPEYLVIFKRYNGVVDSEWIYDKDEELIEVETNSKLVTQYHNVYLLEDNTFRIGHGYYDKDNAIKLADVNRLKTIEVTVTLP